MPLIKYRRYRPNHAAVMVPAPGGGAFTPASLSGLIGWWKADAGVYTDAGTTLATNGQTVQQWNDQSGNGRHLSQATGGSRPTYTTGSLNGLPTIDAGASGFMSRASFPVGGTTISVYVVINNSGTSQRGVTYGSPNDYDPSGFIAPYFPAANNPNAYNNGTTSSLAATEYSNAWIEVFSVWDGTNVTLHAAEPTFGFVSGTPAASTPTFAATGLLSIFADSSGGSLLTNGKIAELVIATNAAAGDRTNMRSYFQSRWGV